jgi:hypothetical protein
MNNNTLIHTYKKNNNLLNFNLAILLTVVFLTIYICYDDLKENYILNNMLTPFILSFNILFTSFYFTLVCMSYLILILLHNVAFYIILFAYLITLI